MIQGLDGHLAIPGVSTAQLATPFTRAFPRQFLFPATIQPPSCARQIFHDYSRHCTEIFRNRSTGTRDVAATAQADIAGRSSARILRLPSFFETVRVSLSVVTQ